MELPTTTCSICTQDYIVAANTCRSPAILNQYLDKLVSTFSPSLLEGHDVRMRPEMCVICEQELLRLHKFLSLMERSYRFLHETRKSCKVEPPDEDCSDNDKNGQMERTELIEVKPDVFGAGANFEQVIIKEEVDDEIKMECESYSESEEDVPVGTPPEIVEMAETASATLLPEKSKGQYERSYKLFLDWRRENRTDSFSENVLLAYFQGLSKRNKPSSMWSIYSMLRTTLKLKNNVDIGKYPKLCEFLKRKSDGYVPKKSKTLTSHEIREFLSSAPNDEYLFTKVALIFGIMGALRREELMKIEVDHIEDLNTVLLVHIPDAKSKTERQFVIGSAFYDTCKKYMQLRPPHATSNRFFLNYHRGKCTKQPIGINKFGNLAKVVARYLKLPDPAGYTGHCIRRTSATTLVNAGAALKRSATDSCAYRNEIGTANVICNTIENDTVRANAGNSERSIAGSSTTAFWSQR